MKIDTVLNSFVAGEISPRLAGRSDIQQYYQSAAELLNMLCEFYGGAKKAPGTYFVAEVNDSSASTRIFKFVFSDTQAYILEFGNLYIRFYKDGGAILETAIDITGIDQAAECTVTAANSYTDGDEIYITGIEGMTELNGRRFIVSNRTAGNFKIKDVDDNYINSSAYTAYSSVGTAARVYTLTTTYTTADLWQLQFAQTADILYITLGKSDDAAKGRPQKKLTRTAHTSWTITDIDYSTGEARPALMDENITTTTITPSAATGTGITLTASTAIFDITHIGSIWKVNTGYVKITDVASGGLKTTATADVLYSGTLTGTSAYTSWSEGAWSGYRGYPKSVTISESRLVYGYTVSQPQTTWGSGTGAYDTFELGSDDADAIEFTADTNQVEVINWLFPANEILVGTPSGISALGTGSDTLALTATTGRMKKKSKDGTSSIMPQQIGTYVYYWQKYNRILGEYGLSSDTLDYETKDATILAEHISESGIVDMDYQQHPYSILWCVRDDGKLAAFTRQIENKVSAWTPHDTQGFYESVAVIPKDSYDEVWFVVRRVIDGVTRRYIEYMVAPEFEEQEDAFFVHSGLSLDNPKTITAITQGDPVVVTSASHGFSNGDRIKIRNVEGMTELNDRTFLVANKADNTFELTDTDGDNIDGTDYEAYVSDGEARECVTSVSGLSHLEGKTVQVLADGASHPDRVVSSGSITLDDYYSQVNVGLGYTGRLKSNDLEPSPGGTSAQGKTKRVSRVFANLYKSLGFKIGTEAKMDNIPFRTSSMATDQAIPLFTGYKEVVFPSGWDKTKQVIITQEQPLPLHILSLAIEMEMN